VATFILPVMMQGNFYHAHMSTLGYIDVLFLYGNSGAMCLMRWNEGGRHSASASSSADGRLYSPIFHLVRAGQGRAGQSSYLFIAVVSIPNVNKAGHKRDG
jgi:hypothetical protein